MLYLIGNGPSRKNLDLETLDNWWGMNMVYRDHTPDLLFVQDVAPQNEMITDQYYKNHPVCVGEWNEIPMEMWEMMKHGLPGEVVENRVEGDDRFVVQGEDYRGEGPVSYTHLTLPTKA